MLSSARYSTVRSPSRTAAGDSKRAGGVSVTGGLLPAGAKTPSYRGSPTSRFRICRRPAGRPSGDRRLLRRDPRRPHGLDVQPEHAGGHLALGARRVPPAALAGGVPAAPLQDVGGPMGGPPPLRPLRGVHVRGVLMAFSRGPRNRGWWG